MRKIFTPTLALFLLLFAGGVTAQTVGLLSFDDSLATPGYNLFYPHNQGTTFLIDNCGRLVHTWTDSADARPGNTAFLMENGDLIKTKRTTGPGDPIWAGGGGAYIEIRGWDNTLKWQYLLNDSLNRLHHDIAPMANGNILAIAWEYKTMAEAIQAGRDTTTLPDSSLWPERIIEIEPIGTNDFNIVWEWRAWDHLVQNFDDTKDNFASVSASPGLIDINYLGTTGGEADWLHANSLDYNEELDQIMISIPEFDEIWIIDHSTTTSEAASHSGGTSGKGGDLIFRWGNPMAYGMGDSTDIQLFYQHDAHWIDRELDPTAADYGKIMVFNNRQGEDFSTVNIIGQEYNTTTNSYPTASGVYEPAGFDWVYSTTPAQNLYSTGLSGAQRLQSGNTLILSGRSGYAFEVTPGGDIVWEYKTPLLAGTPVSQGDTIPLNGNLTFRFYRYSFDYPAFDGRNEDLEPDGYLELNPDSSLCPGDLTGIFHPQALPQIKLFPNPAQDLLYIQLDAARNAEVEVFDLQGMKVAEFFLSPAENKINLNGITPGVYFLRLEGRAAGKFIKM